MKTRIDIKSQTTEGKIINTRINYINPEASFKVLSDFARALINLTTNTYIDAYKTVIKSLDEIDYDTEGITPTEVAEIIAGTYQGTNFEISAADIQSIIEGTYTPPVDLSSDLITSEEINNLIAERSE